jgi:hypothetical protein
LGIKLLNLRCRAGYLLGSRIRAIIKGGGYASSWEVGEIPTVGVGKTGVSRVGEGRGSSVGVASSGAGALQPTNSKTTASIIPYTGLTNLIVALHNMYRSKIAIASKLVNKETNLGNHHSLDCPNSNCNCFK